VPAVPLQHDVRAVHLRPAADLAERVLLPGDPHRALAVAQTLLEAPKMFNHTRGLWGYTGLATDGELLTVQSTGMGGPSAAIVCEELLALGARRLVRIGTCGALVEGLQFGELLAAETVIPADGASAALGAKEPLHADPALTSALVEAGARPAAVVSTDLFYDPRADTGRRWVEKGAVAVEMEAAAILQVAARRGAVAACLVGVTDVPSRNGTLRADAAQLEALDRRLGEVGYAALAS
jgi:purine-nucleoside phosphorylase